MYSCTVLHPSSIAGTKIYCPSTLRDSFNTFSSDKLIVRIVNVDGSRLVFNLSEITDASISVCMSFVKDEVNGMIFGIKPILIILYLTASRNAICRGDLL